MRFLGEVGLVLIDECHLLNDNRGPALEAGAVSRIKMISRAAGMEQVSKSSLLACAAVERILCASHKFFDIGISCTSKH